jgi:hypothetical protein
MDFAKLVFIASATIILLGGSFVSGVAAHRWHLPPVPQLKKALRSVQEVLKPSDRSLAVEKILHDDPYATLRPDALQPGLVLVAGDVDKRETNVRVIDRAGQVVHEWRPRWSEVWGRTEGNFRERPADGQYLHGVELLPDGSLVANFEHKSTFRMDPCGNVLWKLDNLGHHSVHYADDNTLWVSSEIDVATGNTGYPNHQAPLRSWTLQNISLEGEILREIPVIEIFFKNGLEGLLFMSTQEHREPVVSGDTLHLNDVETFPADLESEVFAPGDLLISLRNINAVLVIEPDTLEIKFISIGGFTRQHDPDFIDGDQISVFDNRVFTADRIAAPSASRIVEIDAKSGKVETVLSGVGEEPFFSEIMGVHQRLPNGNFLVVPSDEGRVLEFTSDGKLVWRYDNRVQIDLNMRVYMSSVLPERMDRTFFQKLSASCTSDT